jgi:hypothetical protein
MKRLALALLLAAATPSPSSAPGTSTRALAVHDLPRLTPARAWALHGRRALFLVEPDSAPEEWGGFVLFDCVSPDALYRTVRLFPGQDVEDDTVIEATLRVVLHEPSGPFAGFVEPRLERARRR